MASSLWVELYHQALWFLHTVGFLLMFLLCSVVELWHPRGERSGSTWKYLLTWTLTRVADWIEKRGSPDVRYATLKYASCRGTSGGVEGRGTAIKAALEQRWKLKF